MLAELLAVVYSPCECATVPLAPFDNATLACHVTVPPESEHELNDALRIVTARAVVVGGACGAVGVGAATGAGSVAAFAIVVVAVPLRVVVVVAGDALVVVDTALVVVVAAAAVEVVAAVEVTTR
jgi:hypothetical protein